MTDPMANEGIELTGWLRRHNVTEVNGQPLPDPIPVSGYGNSEQRAALEELLIGVLGARADIGTITVPELADAVMLGTCSAIELARDIEDAIDEAGWRPPLPDTLSPWGAYREAYNAFREENPAWKAHFTQHHMHALGAALRVFEPSDGFDSSRLVSDLHVLADRDDVNTGDVHQLADDIESGEYECEPSSPLPADVAHKIDEIGVGVKASAKLDALRAEIRAVLDAGCNDFDGCWDCRARHRRIRDIIDRKPPGCTCHVNPRATAQGFLCSKCVVAAYEERRSLAPLPADANDRPQRCPATAPEGDLITEGLQCQQYEGHAHGHTWYGDNGVAYSYWHNAGPAVQPADETEPREVLEFLIRRHEAQRKRLEPRCYGCSSDALAYYGAGRGQEPSFDSYPADKWDLAACELTYEMAPPSIQPRMLPLLEKYRAAVQSDEEKRDA